MSESPKWVQEWYNKNRVEDLRNVYKENSALVDAIQNKDLVAIDASLPKFSELQKSQEMRELARANGLAPAPGTNTWVRGEEKVAVPVSDTKENPEIKKINKRIDSLQEQFDRRITSLQKGLGTNLDSDDFVSQGELRNIYDQLERLRAQLQSNNKEVAERIQKLPNRIASASDMETLLGRVQNLEKTDLSGLMTKLNKMEELINRIPVSLRGEPIANILTKLQDETATLCKAKLEIIATAKQQRELLNEIDKNAGQRLADLEKRHKELKLQFDGLSQQMSLPKFTEVKVVPKKLSFGAKVWKFLVTG